jgi:hypothetical protein
MSSIFPYLVKVKCQGASSMSGRTWARENFVTFHKLGTLGGPIDSGRVWATLSGMTWSQLTTWATL